MEQREKLIELLLNSDPLHERDLDDDLADGEIESIADYLLANGVIVPPCKVGDTVHSIAEGITQTFVGEVYEITKRKNDIFFRFTRKGYYSDSAMADYFGKTVFLTRDEAEKALAERSGK